MGEEPSAEEKAETEQAEDNIREMHEYLTSQVMRGKAMGVEFSEVENLLTGAGMLIESGEWAEAAEIISQCMQKASKRFSEHEMLVISIRKAEKEVKAAHEAGADVSEAGRLLKLARLYMEKGEYRLGIETAKKAQDSVTQKKPAEISWGSAVSMSETE